MNQRSGTAQLIPANGDVAIATDLVTGTGIFGAEPGARSRRIRASRESRPAPPAMMASAIAAQVRWIGQPSGTVSSTMSVMNRRPSPAKRVARPKTSRTAIYAFGWTVVVETITLVIEMPLAIGRFLQVRHAFKSWANLEQKIVERFRRRRLFPSATSSQKNITTIDLAIGRGALVHSAVPAAFLQKSMRNQSSHLTACLIGCPRAVPCNLFG